MQTAERVSQHDLSDNYVYQRSKLAYLEAIKIISGDVLEIGTGSGYGVDIMAPLVNQLTTIDKYPNPKIDHSNYGNVTFLTQSVPPFKGLKDNSFDYVVTFQVIEHIPKDEKFVEEIHRVLKPGGQLIVTTPNRPMSITRNPWHVREYTIDELNGLLKKRFSEVISKGVFGNDKIMKYYLQNKNSVEKITKWDIFNLQYRLPRWMLQVPYDILNRINRKKLLDNNQSLVAKLTHKDYSLEDATGNCFDLFFIAKK